MVVTLTMDINMIFLILGMKLLVEHMELYYHHILIIQQYLNLKTPIKI